MTSLASVSQWHEETDILILGFGLAGACAAIEARDLDASVDILIIEKMDEVNAGGNTRASGQSLLISENKDALVEYYKKLSYTNPIPEDMLEA